MMFWTIDLFTIYNKYNDITSQIQSVRWDMHAYAKIKNYSSVSSFSSVKL